MVARRHLALCPPPPLGHAVPNNIHHAISVQMTTWEDMQGLMLRTERILKVQRIGYPRSFLHPDVVQLQKKILNAINEVSGYSCLAFPSINHARACKQCIQAHQPDAPVDIFEILLRFQGNSPVVPVYTTVYQIENHRFALEFWRLTGTGISSRFAENVIRNVEGMTATVRAPDQHDSLQKHSSQMENEAIIVLRRRICQLLQRASLQPEISDLVSPDDIYMYPAGMSAIYHCSRLLNSWRNTGSIVFGFLYELTPKLLQTYSKDFQFYGFGTEEEIDQLEVQLENARIANEPVQSVWCECPSNPLLHTVNFTRLRQLADQYGFVLVVDETIGTFANVDLLPVADILITSLTKAFSGNADVMGGSLVLNPVSPFYNELTRVLQSTYVPELHVLDATVLEYNSRIFLSRVARMNQTACHLVSLLSSYAALPESVITKVFHPSILPSRMNYDVHMRQTDSEMSPGHGALFTIEFESEKAASIFFNNLDIHKGPSLGACITLAQPYVQTVFALEKEMAAYYGLSETIIRISVGLEDPVSLDRAFRKAFSKANCTKLGFNCNDEAISIAERV